MRLDDLAHVPVPLFASAMGWGGLAMAWRKAHEALGWPAWIGEAAALIAAAVFVVVGGLYAWKTARHWDEMVKEFRHPVRVNFFAAISINLMIMGGLALPYAAGLADGLWIVGAGLHFSVALYVIGRWIEHPQDPATFNPAWFIPVVGNVLAPVIGVKLGHTDAAWFFFAVGMVFWLGLLPLALNRAIFVAPPLPPKMLPTLAIFIAPPAVAFLAWRALTVPVMTAPVDPLGHVLIFAALFTALLMLRLITVLARVPFAPSWWAYTFPSAALAAGLAELAAAKGGSAFYSSLAGVLVVAATLIVLLVSARTVKAAFAGHLFVPE